MENDVRNNSPQASVFDLGGRKITAVVVGIPGYHERYSDKECGIAIKETWSGRVYAELLFPSGQMVVEFNVMSVYCDPIPEGDPK